MARIICFASGKGGVGKTTIAVNIGSVLSSIGKETLLIDANLTTPNVLLHLGIPISGITLHDVIKGKAPILDAIRILPNGLKVIPAGISLEDLRGIDARKLGDVILDLVGEVEYILLDSAAGLGKEAIAAIESSDEIIIVTNPELPALADAYKTIKLSEELGKKVTGVIVNKYSGKKYEMKIPMIEKILESKVIGVVPYDENVILAIARRMPVVDLYPNSPASLAIRKIAYYIAGIKEKIKVKEKKEGILSKILGIFRIRK